MTLPLTLLVDADDTLWDNNVYFEEIVAVYCALAEQRGLSADRARQTLDAIERRRTEVDGYGVRNFFVSLCQALGELVGRQGCERERQLLAERCAGLARRAVEPIPGVEAALRELAGRHRLIMLTKGDQDEQLTKAHRSGLRPFFHQIDVVREKDVEAYRDVVSRHGLRPGRTWMIGNSPRSDISPALEAGLRAVFIPHRATWTLEAGELPAGMDGRLLVLDRFSRLTDYF